MPLCFQIVSAPFGYVRKTQAPPTLTHWEVSSALQIQEDIVYDLGWARSDTTGSTPIF